MEHTKFPETNKHESDSDCPAHVRGDRHAGKSRAKTEFQLEETEQKNARIAKKKKKLDYPSERLYYEKQI